MNTFLNSLMIWSLFLDTEIYRIIISNLAREQNVLQYTGTPIDEDTE
jgi:hypothetical protein